MPPKMKHCILILIGVRIHLSEERRVESFSRTGISVGASSKSQQADSRDHAE
jgi:hypothetical protein